MDTQLSRFMRLMTARPCRSSFAPFDGTISSERIAPTACTRLSLRAFFRYVPRLLGDLVGRRPALQAAAGEAESLHARGSIARRVASRAWRTAASSPSTGQSQPSVPSTRSVGSPLLL